jgi:hypothetical protein
MNLKLTVKEGSASQIFPKYINHLDDAVENFCDQHWPCEFVNPHNGVRCVNVRSGHASKGHQSVDGKVFAAGSWMSKFLFDSDGPVFRNWVYGRLVELLKELTTRVQGSKQPEVHAAAEIHRSMVLTNLFSRAKHSDGSSKGHSYLISHTACFCCLFGQAEYCLPCGHVLCSACLETYGNNPGYINGLEVTSCPFETATEGIYPPWIFQLKPKSAGIRVMTLDG